MHAPKGVARRVLTDPRELRWVLGEAGPRTLETTRQVAPDERRSFDSPRPHEELPDELTPLRCCLTGEEVADTEIDRTELVDTAPLRRDVEMARDALERGERPAFRSARPPRPSPAIRRSRTVTSGLVASSARSHATGSRLRFQIVIVAAIASPHVTRSRSSRRSYTTPCRPYRIQMRWTTSPRITTTSRTIATWTPRSVPRRSRSATPTITTARFQVLRGCSGVRRGIDDRWHRDRAEDLGHHGVG